MKQRSHWISQAGLVFVGGILVTFFQNCGVHKPSVENMQMASAVYSHTGLEVSCLACHAADRPSTQQGFLNLRPNAPFDYTNHGSGLDCIQCHDGMTASQRTRVDWAQGFFVHKPTLTSCQDCHQTERPTLTRSGTVHVATGDCFSCHAPSLNSLQGLDRSNEATLSMLMWQGASGVPAGPVWQATSDVSVVVSSPLYASSGLLSNWTNQAQFLHQPMNHAQVLPGINVSACGICHVDTTTFTGGRLHSSLNSQSIAQPTTCVGCHQESLPKTTVSAPEAFVGPVTGQDPILNPSKFNHSVSLGLADCQSCHQQVNWALPSWGRGQFHRPSNIPATCVECHRPTRPSALVGAGQFNHATDGMGECAGCHIDSVRALAQRTAFDSANRLTKSDWAGAVSTPTGLVGSLSLSVSSLKINYVGGALASQTASIQTFALQMDHSQTQTNCSSCHQSSSSYQGAHFHVNQTSSPATCTRCHTTALGGFVVGDSLGKALDHAHSSVVSLDCKTCHTSPSTAQTGLNFKDGQLHSKLIAQPSSCRECHGGKVLVKPIWGTMDHSTIGSQDCKSCHSFPGAGGSIGSPTWAGASGGVPAQISLTPPSGKTWGNLGVPHPSLKLSGISCASCHGSSTSAKIVGYDHLNPPTGIQCVYCHYSQQTVVGVTVKTKNHEGAGPTKDCNSSGCHNSSSFSQFGFPIWNATTKSWSGGKWK